MSLTSDDLNNIKNLLKSTLYEESTIVRRDDLKYLPTKQEVYVESEKILAEVKVLREEVAALATRKRARK